MGKKLDESVTTTETVCPRWSHIINNDEYKSGLAKKQLLKSPARLTLPDNANKTWSLTESINNLQTSWKLCEAMQKQHLAGSLENAAAVNEMAALCLSVTAACNIIEDFGPTQAGQDMATEFLTSPRPKGFPKILEKKLAVIKST